MPILKNFCKTFSSSWGRLLMGVVTVFMLNGCAVKPWTLMQNKEYAFPKKGYAVTVGADWMRLNYFDGLLLTKNGLDLDHIFVGRKKISKPLPFTKRTFDPDMSLQEIAEVEVANFMGNAQIFNFQIIDNQPATIAGRDVYQITYSYQTDQELRMKGLQYGFVTDVHVYHVRYEAAALHYFDNHLPEFEQFIASLRWL